MSLHALLNKRPSGPYFRPPPITVNVVATREQFKVLKWDFDTSPPKPSLTKKNIIAAITDGESVCKINVLEEFADKINAGITCVLRGYTLQGQSPPYSVTITKDTRFFQCPHMIINEDIKQQATALIDPPSSPFTPIHACKERQGLMTVEGEVIEVIQYISNNTLQISQYKNTKSLDFYITCIVFHLYVNKPSLLL